MKRVAGATLGMLVGALACVGAATPAAALAPTAVGWWWVAEQGPATVPPPPTVPAGGFMVGADPSGPNSVAALHFALADDDSAPVLTLTVADNGNLNGASDAVVACQSASPWKPESPGAWANKPAGRCDTNAKGTLSTDSKTMTFALTPLVSADGTTLDIVLLPASGASFEMSFNAPTATSLTTTKVAPSSTTDSGSSFDTSSDISTADTSASDQSTDALTPLLTTPFAATQAPPTDNPTLQITTVRPTPVNRSVVGTQAPTRSTPAVAILLLMLVAGAAWAVTRAPMPAVRRLGPMSTSPPPAASAREPAGPPAVGGLGRFARERRGAPPRL
jgi:hypothetical protein